MSARQSHGQRCGYICISLTGQDSLSVRVLFCETDWPVASTQLSAELFNAWKVFLSHDFGISHTFMAKSTHTDSATHNDLKFMIHAQWSVYLFAVNVFCP